MLLTLLWCLNHFFFSQPASLWISHQTPKHSEIRCGVLFTCFASFKEISSHLHEQQIWANNTRTPPIYQLCSLSAFTGCYTRPPVPVCRISILISPEERYFFLSSSDPWLVRTAPDNFIPTGLDGEELQIKNIFLIKTNRNEDCIG